MAAFRRRTGPRHHGRLGILLALPLAVAFTAEWLLTRLAGDTVGMQAAPRPVLKVLKCSSCSPPHWRPPAPPETSRTWPLGQVPVPAGRPPPPVDASHRDAERRQAVIGPLCGGAVAAGMPVTP
ncbi:hypothetical protein [Nonomuraea salmonea]|uniref:hypothetical protein n=1 Tax=Nonomuraea salmonea TaxID=46181 RepID=UPI0031E5CA8B